MARSSSCMSWWSRWRGPVVDGAAFAVTLASMLVELFGSPKDDPSGALSVAAIVVLALPILVRRRWPRASFAVAMVLVFALVGPACIYETIGIPAVICAYTLAATHGRRAALWAGVGAMPVVVAILQLYSPHAIITWDYARNLALVALPLAFGVAAHERRAATQALVERAESAERTREEEALRRVGEERLRIARDVHDVVAHAMVAINVQAGVGAHLLERDPDQARATLRDIKRVSGDALTDLRSMLGLLRPDDDAPVVPTQGLAQIDDLREGLASAGVDLDVTIDPAADQLPVTVGTAGFRIVQEALTNVLRHVGPTAARVRVTREPHTDDGRRDVLRIEVEDDGGTAPTPLDATGSGNGLRGMRERAAAVGGSLEAGPRADGGWRVSALLPVAVDGTGGAG
ncbi:sensor histidine kinase [Nocardioides sp. C4-1]|uniref:sensor histidine kinase n=1 Tax=Nocardioides sp. C4-1 TaxID=3151851 RepID=UPI0032647782